jgi:two-component system cell cycle sensor histidine kinase/response regulator CckA
MTVNTPLRRGLAAVAEASWLPPAIGIVGVTAALVLWQSLSIELSARVRGPLAGVVLAAGLIVSLLPAASAGLAQRAWRRARESEAAYAALRESETRKGAMIEASLDGIVMMDRDGHIVDFNAAAERIFGYPRSEAIGRLLADLLIPPRLREGHRQGLATYLATGQGRVLGRRLRLPAMRSDGAEFPVELSIIALKTEATLFLGFIRDLSSEQRAEEARVRSEEQYRLLFDNNPQPMWVYDLETLAFLAVNDAAVRHYGYSRDEFLAMGARDVYVSDETRTAEDAVGAAREANEREPTGSLCVRKHRKRDGALVDVESAVSPIEFRGRKAGLELATDLTAKKRLEAQLLQSQRMESVGRLAGGIAHDFNNLLGVITGYGELLSRRLADQPGLRKYVADIVKAAERAADLTRQLLAFSRKQVLQPRILDLNTTVAEMEKMLRRLIGEDIHLVTVFADRLGRVKADPGQLEQVIMNLAVNASDAMPQGGRLTIETANASLDDSDARSRPGTKPGPHVVLAVSDTGHGMGQEVLSHLFEPFFTTKEAGKGTGLGLATVHGIVTQSGGHISVHSEAGHGTVFKVYLPSVETAADALPAVSATAEGPKGAETVLLVEDETSLRSLVRECLETSGYTVLEARHAEHALAIAGSHPAAIDLLITDVVMPVMSGRELARRVAVSRPGMKVLYMSGYTDDAVVLHGVLAADVAFLQKPFTTEALARKLRAVLDQ